MRSSVRGHRLNKKLQEGYVIQHFRQRLHQGDMLLGTGVTLTSPEVCELLAEAGFDWLFLDAEHAPLESSALQAMLQAAGRDEACLCLLYTSPSPRDGLLSRMPSSA